MAHDVFISYSTQDKPTADAVCAKLEQKRIRCWIAPRDVMPGVPWAEAVIEAINGSNVLVLVFSSHANRSDQVMREIERAANRGVPILPLRIEAVTPAKSIELFISAPHWLDAMSPPLEQHLDGLVGNVEALLRRREEKDTSASAARVVATAPAPADGAPPTPTTTPAGPGAIQSAARWMRQRALLVAGAAAAIAALGVVAIVLALASGGGGDDAQARTTPDAASGQTEQPAATTQATSEDESDGESEDAPEEAGDAAPPGAAPDGGEISVVLAPSCVSPGGRLEAQWGSSGRQTGDLIGLFPVTARNNEYVQWTYISTSDGRVMFTAPDEPGTYDGRIIRQNSHLATSEGVRVEAGCPNRSDVVPAEGSSLTVLQECVEPGGRMEVTWTAENRQTGDFVGIFALPSANNDYVVWDYVNTTAGSLIYEAPAEAGLYEARMIRQEQHLSVSAPVTVGAC